MTLDEFIEFLEPQPEHTDDHGTVIPARAGAVCQSAEDTLKIKTALEQACRQLGSGCSYELKRLITSRALGGE